MERFEKASLGVRISGSSDAHLRRLATQSLDIGISGSGGVAGDGSAARLKVRIAGSGDVELSDMASDEVSITIAGSGDAQVYSRQSLDARIAGSGDVSYRGDPAKVNAKVAGSGSVQKR